MQAFLEGVRVLDFTQALSGPFATMLLGDLGADVIKVESPRGDDSRRWGPPFVGNVSTYFISLNRNKRSVVLDLKTAPGREAARSLAKVSDVVIENFRPGTAAKLDVDRRTVQALNPNVVYCSITGFGKENEQPGYDQIVQGEAGLMSVTGFPDGPPTKVGIPAADIAAGASAAQAILGALFDRARTGRGHVIDVTMKGALLSFMAYHVSGYLHSGNVPERAGNHHSSIAPYGAFECADRYLNICVGNDRQWRGLCDAIGRPDWIHGDQYRTNSDRVQAKRQLKEDLEAVLRQEPAGHWLQALAERGVPAGQIKDLAAVFPGAPGDWSQDIVEMRGLSGPLYAAAPPWHFGGEIPRPTKAPPQLGADTGEVLRELIGYDETKIAQVAGGSEVTNEARAR